jgi:hypothetical protein
MGKYGVVLNSFSKDEGLKININLHHDVYNTDLKLIETAMIAKFNKEGEMLWSQVFKMYLWYKPYTARTFIRIAAQEQNSIQLVYADGRNIYSKSISFDGEILNEKTSNPINTNNENDKLKESYSNISFWYDKYFLSYGVQSIKNKVDDDVKRKRTVVFLNKVSFE